MQGQINCEQGDAIRNMLKELKRKLSPRSVYLIRLHGSLLFSNILLKKRRKKGVESGGKGKGKRVLYDPHSNHLFFLWS